MPKLKTSGKIHDSLTGYNFLEDKPLSPRKAIRKKCLECAGGSAYEVKVCELVDCPNWPLRMGRGICTDPTGTTIQMPARSAAQIKARRQAGKRMAQGA